MATARDFKAVQAAGIVRRRHRLTAMERRGWEAM